MTVDLSSAPEIDLVIDQGFDRDFSVVYKVEGVPQDLTGWRVTMGLRAGYAEPVYLLFLDSDVPSDSFIQLQGVTGRAVFHMDHVDTVNLPARTYVVFDARYISPDGAQTKKIMGRFYVRPQVTANG